MKLSERVAELETCLGMRPSVPKPSQVNRRVWQMAGLLATHRLLTRELALGALYGGEDEPDLRSVDATICRVRKQLGVKVHADFGRGYYVDDPTRKKLKAMLEC